MSNLDFSVDLSPQSDYTFTVPWFLNTAKNVWDTFIPQLRPQRILEIGSFEGASACYLIESLGSQQELDIHCIDTWQGGI